MKHILIIGSCGSGKTWIMKQLINKLSARKAGKLSLLRFRIAQNVWIMGQYTGETFDGGDRLSMAVSKDFKTLKKVSDTNKVQVIAEGDRFMNANFIDTFNPYIIKIKDKGEEGRKKRGSKQSSQHLQRIDTRVRNTKESILVENSAQALDEVLKQINYEN